MSVEVRFTASVRHLVTVTAKKEKKEKGLTVENEHVFCTGGNSESPGHT